MPVAPSLEDRFRQTWAAHWLARLADTGQWEALNWAVRWRAIAKTLDIPLWPLLDTVACVRADVCVGQQIMSTVLGCWARVFPGLQFTEWAMLGPVRPGVLWFQPLHAQVGTECGGFMWGLGIKLRSPCLQTSNLPRPPLSTFKLIFFQVFLSQ